MKATNTNIQNNSNIKLFVMFVLLFLSSTAIFAQETKEIVTIVEPTTIVTTDNSIASSSTDFAMWFVGNMKSTTTTRNTSFSFSKKSLINSGINSNKILIKKVIKTIVSQENNIA